MCNNRKCIPIYYEHGSDVECEHVVKYEQGVEYEHLSGAAHRWTCCRRHEHVVEEANMLLRTNMLFNIMV